MKSSKHWAQKSILIFSFLLFLSAYVLQWLSEWLIFGENPFASFFPLTLPVVTYLLNAIPCFVGYGLLFCCLFLPHTARRARLLWITAAILIGSTIAFSLLDALYQFTVMKDILSKSKQEFYYYLIKSVASPSGSLAGVAQLTLLALILSITRPSQFSEEKGNS